MSSFCQGLQKAVQNQDLDIHWKNNAAFLSLAYGVPTLALNIRVASMLFLNRKREEFSSQFYTLFIIATILESLWWIFSQLADRFANSTIIGSLLYNGIPEQSFINTLIFFSMNYLMFAEMIITVLLTLNRLVTIIFAPSNEQIWNKILPVGLLAVFVVPLAFSWQVWFNVIKCKISTQNDEEYFIILQDNAEFNYGITLSLAAFILAFLSAFISFILNSITLAYIAIQHKKTLNKVFSTSRQTSTKSTEFKLFTFSLILFLDQAIIGTLQVVFFISSFHPEFKTDRLYETYRFAKDIMCLTPSVFLLIMSKNVRKEIFRWPKFKFWFKRSTNEAVPVRTVTSSKGADTSNIYQVRRISNHVEALEH